MSEDQYQVNSMCREMLRAHLECLLEEIIVTILDI